MSIGTLSGFLDSLCAIAHLSALECVIFAGDLQKYAIDDPLSTIVWVIRLQIFLNISWTLSQVCLHSLQQTAQSVRRPTACKLESI